MKEMYDMLMLPLIQGEQAKRKLKLSNAVGIPHT
jgi:hypothetical protein